jgi:hypothetical protein
MSQEKLKTLEMKHDLEDKISEQYQKERAFGK